MRQALNNCVLVVEDRPASADPELSEACQAQRTLVLQPGNASKVAVELLRERPRVIVAHVPRGFSELLRVIDLVRASGHETSIIAVSEDHDDRVEMALRTAGVTCYASDNASLNEALRQTADEPLLNRADPVMTRGRFPGSRL